MALTQIADVVVPTIFSPYVREMSTSTNALLNSGILRLDPRLAALVAGGGTTVNVPFSQSVGRTTDSVATDDTTLITAAKLGTGTMVGARLVRTNAWSNADLAGLLAGIDPGELIASEVAESWNFNMQAVLLNILKGVFADNDSNDGGDQTFSIYSDISSPLAANLISLSAIIETKALAGDKKSQYNTMILHSDVMKQLELLEENSFVPASETKTGFPEYAGFKLIVDDDMTQVAGTNSPAYSTYLFKQGAIMAGFNDSGNYIPEAVERNELQGTGMGVETLVSRRDYSFHPVGYSFTGSPAGATATNAELAAAGSWDRVYDIKNCGVLRLVSNA